MSSPSTLLTEAQVRERLGGVSHVTIWRWVRANQFPAPIKPGGGSMSRWLEREVDEHIEARAAERTAGIVRAATS